MKADSDGTRHDGADATQAAIAMMDRTELVVGVDPLNSVEWRGTSEQLIAEGVIPAGQCWPELTRPVKWVACGFEFELRRRQPRGDRTTKWVDADYWSVHRRTVDHDWNAAAIQLKARELVAEFHCVLPAGVPLRKRHLLALQDSAFQSAMVRIGAKAPERPRRKRA